MKSLFIAGLVLLAGCSTAGRDSYYLASQQLAAEATRAYQARMDALATVARANPEQGSAIAMAIALSAAPQAQVAYVEDPALKWASVLAGPVAAVAGVYINSQQAVDLAKINQRTQVAGINAQTAQQTAAYAAIAQSGGDLVSTTNGLIELTRDSLNLVDSTVGQSYEFATTTGEQAYQFGGEALVESYGFSGDVFGSTVEWAEFFQSNYDPVVVPPLVIQPVEITPVIVTPTP